MSFRRLKRDRSVSRESCAWSSSWEAELGSSSRDSRDATVGFDARSLQSRDGLLPGFVCRLGCLLNVQLRRRLLNTVECDEIGGSGYLRETRLQDLLREKACPNCALVHCLDARCGCDGSSQVCTSSDVSRSFEPNSRLACAVGRLRHALFCEAVGRAVRVAVNPQDVVDTANSQTFSKEGELCLRALAELDAFVLRG